MSDQSPRKAGGRKDSAQKYDEELAQPPSAAAAPAIDQKELKNGAQERSKQLPMLEKVLAVFQK